MLVLLHRVVEVQVRLAVRLGHHGGCIFDRLLLGLASARQRIDLLLAGRVLVCLGQTEWLELLQGVVIR